MMNGNLQFNISQFAVGRGAAVGILGHLDNVSNQRFVVLVFPSSDKVLVLDIRQVLPGHAMLMNPPPIPPPMANVDDLKTMLALFHPGRLGVEHSQMRFRVSDIIGGYRMLQDNDSLTALVNMERIIYASNY